jgi:hypothetical protein
MRPVSVFIFHAAAPSDAGPLVRALVETRRGMAERQRAAFIAAGADSARIIEGPPDGRSFGERLVAELTAPVSGGSKAGGSRPGASAPTAGRASAGPATGPAIRGGVVVLGSGSIPLARPADLRRFVEVAASPGNLALANNRYSADVVAISRAAALLELPPLPADNALPRWLEERAGVTVTDTRLRWRLGVDIDTPLDLIMLGSAGGQGSAAAPLVGERLAALADVLRNRRAELLVAGRISASTLHWLETGVACRVRALVEERGMRAASELAQSGAGNPGARPPNSTLGHLLDRDGPEALAGIVAKMADAAVIDTRVLMAHRYGPAEASWPRAEDRYASDLLLTPSIADPWLASLTDSACGSEVPILLGGHTAVNGGLRLLATRALTAGR